jgi:hypothetical protein
MVGFHRIVCAQPRRRTALIGIMSMLGVGLGASPTEARLLHPKHHEITHLNFRQDGWRLAMTTNVFSGGTACRLTMKNGNAFYRMGAVGFRFPRGLDVSNAAYRIDGAAPRRSRDDLPELIARGTPVDRGPRDQAAQGFVWIPYEALESAKTVTIQPRPDKAVRTRRLDGLVKLHDLAVEHGCTSEHSFVE